MQVYNGMLVSVRTSFNLRRRDVDKLNAVKVVLNL